MFYSLTRIPIKYNLDNISINTAWTEELFKVTTSNNTNISYPIQALPGACFMLVSCFAHFSVVNMEAACCCQTSAEFQRSPHRYVAEGRNLRNHFCENLES
jgi:hypothetical protein